MSWRGSSLCALLFLTIYGWKITYFLDLIFVLSAALVCALLVMDRRRPSTPITEVSVLLIAVVGYSALVALANGGRDLFFVLRGLRVFVNFAGMYALACFYRRHWADEAKTVALVHVYAVLGIHSLLICVMYLVPAFRDAVYAIANTAVYVNDTMPFKTGLRVPGLTYGLATTSVLQVSSLLLFPWVWRVCSHGWWRRTWLIVLAVCSAVAVLLTGRTGILLGALLMPLMLVLLVTSSPRRASALAWFQGIGLVAVGAAGVYAAIEFGPEQLSAYNINKAGEVLGFFQGSSESETLGRLQTMWFLPDGVAHVIFGSSNSGRGSMEYIPSDVGYVRVLHALGIVGSLIFLAVPLVILLHACVRWRRSPALASAVIVFTLAALSLHAKDVGLMTRNHWSVHAFLYCVLTLQSGRTASWSMKND